MNAGKQLDLIVVALLALTAPARAESARDAVRQGNRLYADGQYAEAINRYTCLLYTSDAADELLCVPLGGRRLIKNKIKRAVTDSGSKTHSQELNTI